MNDCHPHEKNVHYSLGKLKLQAQGTTTTHTRMAEIFKWTDNAECWLGFGRTGTQIFWKTVWRFLIK